MTKKIEFTESCGNVFADLGLENADEMLAKSTLAIMARKIIKKRGLTQAQAAKIFGTHQTQIARLNKGSSVKSMSFDLLLSWLTKLDQDVTVTVKRKPRNQESATVHVAV
jgi:predicted XRE-type DNA-binding protein